MINHSIEELDKNQFQPKMTIPDAANFLGISIQAVHKQLKSKDIHCPKIGNKSYINHEIAKSLFKLNFDQKIIVCQIVKGGTGKTTTIENMASCANTYGARVLKIDADPQGNLTDANGIDPDNIPVLVDVINGEASIEDSIVNISDGVDLLPSRIENVILDNIIVNSRLPLHTLYSDLLVSVEKNYDFIFIDCPPHNGPSSYGRKFIC